MSKKIAKLAQIGARIISGEMAIKDIPVSPMVDLEALKEGDVDPLEVIVEVPVSQSKRGWYYTHEALRDIVDAVNERTLHGFLGHQKPEDVPNEFPEPVTHWIGAKMTENAAYFRGVVDAGAEKLKRWIRGGIVKQVSIFGEAHLAESNGSTHVVGYDPLSIDWTPLDRMGMPTRIVAVGEMHGLNLPYDNPYSKEGGNDFMKPEEVLLKLKEMHNNKQITPTMIANTLGVTAVQLAGEMDGKFQKEYKQMDAVMKELDVSGEMDAVAYVKDLKNKAEHYEVLQAKQVIGEMVAEKLENEQAVKDFMNVETPLGALWNAHSQNFTGDEKALSAEMDTFLQSTAVRSLLDSYELMNNYQPGNSAILGEMKDNNKKQSNTIKGARITRAAF